MREVSITKIIVTAVFVLLSAATPVQAEDQIVHVPLRANAPGVTNLFSYCFAKLRDAGFDPEHFALSRIGACMQAETQEALEFSYQVLTLLGNEITESYLNLCVDEWMEASNRFALDRDDSARVQITWKSVNECLADAWGTNEQTLAARRAAVSKALSERKARSEAARKERMERNREKAKKRKEFE